MLTIGPFLGEGWPVSRAQAQTANMEAAGVGEMETDRDSFTPATSTVARSYTISEAAYSFIDNRIGPESHSFPELLVRHGLTDRFELRLGWNYEAGGSGTVTGNEVGGEDLEAEEDSRVLYGFKYQTSYQAGWIPESSFILQCYTPTSGPSSQTTLAAGQVVGWTFGNGWTWNSAIRYGTGYDEGDFLNQWAPSTVLKIPLGERLNVHAEYFGIMTTHAAQNTGNHFSSIGGHVLITPDLEFGVRVGFGLTDDSPRFFNNVGFGWRF